jgi:hypothetical protein
MEEYSGMFSLHTLLFFCFQLFACVFLSFNCFCIVVCFIFAPLRTMSSLSVGGNVSCILSVIGSLCYLKKNCYF